jgi:hypothetical protein
VAEDVGDGGGRDPGAADGPHHGQQPDLLWRQQLRPPGRPAGSTSVKLWWSLLVLEGRTTAALQAGSSVA